MKKKMIISSILLISIILIVIVTVRNNNKNLVTYSKDYTYMNTYFNIKIYSKKSESKVNKTFNEINKILNDYHNLYDRYNNYDNINNIWFINNNNLEIESLEIDPKLYETIKYGVEMHNYSNGLININLGNVIDVWKRYREIGQGIPTIDELKNSGSTNINDIVLMEGNNILNSHPNIDLGAIAKGYVTNIISKYLIDNGYKSYLINAGGHLVLGDKYHSDLYRIAIRKPNDEIEGNIILKLSNVAVSTSGGYERYYEYNGKTYHHIIDPNTLFPSDKMLSVTVITKDSALADTLSTMLFIMTVEEGKEMIDNMDGVEAVWYTLDNQVIKSEGFNIYE